MLFGLLWKGLSLLSLDVEIPSRSKGDVMPWLFTPLCSDCRALVFGLDNKKEN